MKLTRNFSLSELIKSDTAIRLGIDNNPNADQMEKLKLLCENILQPVRDHFGRVTVTSCFRSPELCVKIGSSLNSQHTKAEAVDFECLGTSNAEVFDWIKANLDWDQYPQRSSQHKLLFVFVLFCVLCLLTVVFFQDHNY
jgi:zinc D-Ala-D-Ala carboxypeptidase